MGVCILWYLTADRGRICYGHEVLPLVVSYSRQGIRFVTGMGVCILCKIQQTGGTLCFWAWSSASCGILRWDTITSQGCQNIIESQIFVVVFLRFAETNLFRELSILFFQCVASFGFGGFGFRNCRLYFSNALLRLRARLSVPPSRPVCPFLHPKGRRQDMRQRAY